MLVSGVYQDHDEDLEDLSPVGLPPGGSVTARGGSEASSGEVQYLGRTERIDLIAGGGYSEGENLTNITFALGPSPPFPPPISVSDDSDTHHTNFYLYTHIRPAPTVSLTIGASEDFYRGPPNDQNQVNPKVGVTWSPVASTTLRVAGFRALKRPFISQQTLEPTQVAGFQQFFDDADGTDSTRYGVGIDHKVSSDLFEGWEISKRDAAVPIEAVTPGAPSENNLEEWLIRAYVYWTPLTWLAVRAEYLQDELNASDITREPGAKMTTKRVPLGLNAFHDSGLFATLVGTYIDQEGVFQDAATSSFQPGEEQFWIIDGALGYRLPRRLGLLTVEAKNLFDQDFQYQDRFTANPVIQPGRVIFVRLTLSL